MSLSARNQRSLVLGLLRYAAGSGPSVLIHSICDHRPAARATENRQFLHMIAAGLAPLMYRATLECPRRIPPGWRDSLKSADLTAQVRSENLNQTAADVIDACLGLGVRPTLLKGISISHQHYPIPHLRPMGDIDILVPAVDFERVEVSLIDSGLIRASAQLEPEGSYHGIPLYHPRRRIWIEIHSALFPKGSDFGGGELFSPAQIAAHSIDSSFLGRPVYRLTDELQLVYIAASWIQDLSRNSLHASLALPLLDAIYLLRSSKKNLDWNGLVSRLDKDEYAATSLYIMLAYLCRRGLITETSFELSLIASKQRIVGVWERAIIELLLDAYLIEGRLFSRWITNWTARIVLNTLLTRGSHISKVFAIPWNIVFPPLLPDRYRVSFHVRRVFRIFRKRARDRH